MPSFYEELMKADFSGLETLGGKWEEVHGKINGLPGRILDEVLKPLRDKGYWEGAAAPYAWTQIDDMQRQVESAAKVAESVAKVVKDGAGELKAVQRELKDAVDRIKQKTGFSVSHEGKVSYTGTIHADTQKDVDHAQDEIIEILRRAVVTDQNLSMSLMADVGVDTWFNAKPQLTDINHTGTLGIERYNQLGLALAGEDPTPQRHGESPYSLGWDWATGQGDKNRTFTTGDKLTELISTSANMNHVREETLKNWREKGEGTGSIPFKLADKGFWGSKWRLVSEDLPAIVTGDEAKLGEAFMGSYNLDYEVKGTDSDGSVIVQYSISNTTSKASLMHYVGYGDWLEAFNSDSGPGGNVSQNVVWTEKIPPHGK